MAGTDDGVPGTKPAGTDWAIIGIFLILAFAAMAAARDFLMPLSMGVLLFFVFSPVCRALARFGLPQPVAAGLVTLGLTFGLIGAVAMLAVPLSDAVNNAPRIFNRIQIKLEQLRDPMEDLQNVARELSELSHPGQKKEPTPPGPAPTDAALPEPPPATPAAGPSGVASGLPPDAPPDAPADAPNGTPAETPDEGQPPPPPPAGPESGLAWLTDIASTTPALLAQLVFTLFLLYFMLASGELLYRRVVESFAGFGDKRKALQAMHMIEASLGSYLGTITLINAGLGVAVAVAMWAWDMPQPALFGVMGFAFNFIPYLGAVAGVVLATAVAFVSMPGFIDPLLVGATYMALTTVEGNLITPSLVSRQLSLNAVVVFVAVALWAWLWSVVGMIVAVPMLVVLRVLCEHIPRLDALGNFLAGEDSPSPRMAERLETNGRPGPS